jgi:hypothetical protein
MESELSIVQRLIVAREDLPLGLEITREALILEKRGADAEHDSRRDHVSGKKAHDLDIMVGVTEFLLGENDRLGLGEIIERGRTRLVDSRKLVNNFPALAELFEAGVSETTDLDSAIS